jgi:hypothetical protein
VRGQKADGILRHGWAKEARETRLVSREPIDKSSDPESENRALFAGDAKRQAAIEKQRRRIAKAIRPGMCVHCTCPRSAHLDDEPASCLRHQECDQYEPLGRERAAALRARRK